MSEPIAYQIVKALRDRLYAINPENGYNTTPCVVLGFRPVTPEELDNGPVILIYEVSDDVRAEDTTTCAVMHIELSVVVEGMMRMKGQASSEALADLWQDMARAIFQSDASLGGLAVSVSRLGRDFVYPEPGGETIAVRQNVGVTYFETYGDP